MPIPENPEFRTGEEIREGGEPTNNRVAATVVLLGLSFWAVLDRCRHEEVPCSSPQVSPVPVSLHGGEDPPPTEEERSDIRTLIGQCIDDLDLIAMYIISATIPTDRTPTGKELHTAAESMKPRMRENLQTIARYLIRHPREMNFIGESVRNDLRTRDGYALLAGIVPKGSCDPARDGEVRHTAREFMRNQCPDDPQYAAHTARNADFSLELAQIMQ